MRKRVIYQESDDRWVSVTVHECSYLDRGHYYKLWKDGSEAFAEETGFDIETEIEDGELIALRNLIHYRAEMLASVKRESSKGSTLYPTEVSTDQGQTWVNGEHLPSEWVDLSSMAHNMPVSFLDTWLVATRELNAGVLPSVPDFLASPRSSISEIS